LLYQLIIHACSEADLRKNNFCKCFLSFFLFQCEAFGRLLFASGRVWLSRPDDSVTRPDAHGSNGWTASLHVRTRATYLHISKATLVRTRLMIHPDGDPTASIKPSRRIFSLPHSFSHSLLAVCECLLARFCFFSPSFVLLCITNHIPGIFSVNIILFSFF
jgi:hypothetical protein